MPKLKRANFTTGHFESVSSQAKIYYRNFHHDSNNGEKSPCKGLVVIHDFYDYHIHYDSLLSHFSTSLEGRLAPGQLDLKGCGLSTGTRGHIRDFDEYLGDIIKFINTIVKKDVILLGQGSGPIAGLRMIQKFSDDLKYRVKGLILSNPLFAFKKEGWEKGVRFFLKKGGNLLSKIRIPYSISGEMLTNCPKSATQHNKDPLIHCRFSAGLFKQILETSDKIENFKVPLPTLFLIGNEDPLCDREKTILYHKRMNQQTSLKTYPHMKHDLFNDPGSRTVFKDIETWLKKIL